MIILRDDFVIELFDSPDTPPSWIEGIDIENNEFQFCDFTGLQYIGILTRPSGLFRQAEWHLEASGDRDIQNALNLIDRAKALEPNDLFSDLETLRSYITNTSA